MNVKNLIFSIAIKLFTLYSLTAYKFIIQNKIFKLTKYQTKDVVISTFAILQNYTIERE